MFAFGDKWVETVRNVKSGASNFREMRSFFVEEAMSFVKCGVELTVHKKNISLNMHIPNDPPEPTIEAPPSLRWTYDTVGLEVIGDNKSMVGWLNGTFKLNSSDVCRKIDGIHSAFFLFLETCFVLSWSSGSTVLQTCQAKLKWRS